VVSQDVVVGVRNKSVVSETLYQRVDTNSTDKCVVVIATTKMIVTCFGVKQIVSGPAFQRIVAVPAS
jgi:hypothetical protein